MRNLRGKLGIFSSPFNILRYYEEKKIPREFLFHIFYIIYHFLIIPGRCRAQPRSPSSPHFSQLSLLVLENFFYTLFYFAKRFYSRHVYISFIFMFFFILRLFSHFFFLHSRILCEMGKNTLLLCKETLNVPLCVFSILSAFYSQSNFQRENMAAFKIHFAGCEIWRCG